MEFLNKEELVESVSSEDVRQQIKMRAQCEIIEGAGGDAIAMEWIETNGELFNEILNDPQYNFYNLLANEETHEDAIKKIRTRLYN